MASLNLLTSALTKKQVAHLLRRTTFGASKAEIESLVGMTSSQILDQLVQEYDVALEPPLDPLTGLEWVNSGTVEGSSDRESLDNFVLSWWVDLMMKNDLNMVERMVFFFHTHFTNKRSKLLDSRAMFHQISLFRHYAFGNFKELTRKMCTDNGMIKFLDGNSNVLGSPQENFARELLELFSIGKGDQIGPEDYTHYTETDVQEAAKVLSGFGSDSTYTNLDEDTGIPTGIVKTTAGAIPEDLTARANKHDETVKTFSGTLGNGGTTIEPNELSGDFATVGAVYTELDELIDMIFAKEETAKFLCREFYRFFVHYCITDEIENDIIIPLANTLRDNDYEIKPVLEQLINSQHFYDADNALLEDDTRGGLIKSPLELTLGTFKFFQVDFGDLSDLETFYEVYRGNVLDLMRDQGMSLFEPFEVAGYSAYHQYPEYNRHWITASNLGYRYQLIDSLIAGFSDGDGNPLNIALDVMKLVTDTSCVANPELPNDIVDFFVDHLYTQPIRNERYEYFRDQILLDTLSIQNWESEWQMYLSSGDDTSVKLQIEALVREIIQSPEYQLF